MILTIGTGNSAVDMIPYIAHEEGLKWQRGDIDSADSGRTMDGIMRRGRVSTKIRLDVKCRPLKSAELGIVLNAILPEYITVTYSDPMYGTVTKTMYSNNNPAVFLQRRPDGTELWSGVTFPLIER